MNTTISINLDQRSFILDEAAYEVLKQYLSDIELHFGNDEDGKEIVQDIEARIAELCASKLSQHKNVIGMGDVEGIIAEMGSVADITGQDTDSTASSGSHNEQEAKSESKSGNNSAGSSSWHPGKKLMRDTDNEVVGGVCAGLAAYLGIDVTLVRIFFVVFLLLSFGTALLIYVILWIAMPEAKTASDKLQMRGEPVTVAGIQQSVKEAVDPKAVTAGKTQFEQFMHGVWNMIRQVFEVIKLVVIGVVPILAKFIGIVVVGCTTGIMIVTTALAVQLLWLGDTLPAQLGGYTPWLQVLDVVPQGAKVALIATSYGAIILALVLIFFWGIALYYQRRILPTGVSVGLILACTIAASAAGSIGLRYGEPVVGRFMEVQATYEQNLPTVVVPLEGAYSQVATEDGVRVEIAHGEANTAEVVGPEAYVNDVKLEVVDGVLHVGQVKKFFWAWCWNCNLQGAKVVVTMPEITRVDASGGSRVSIDTWPVPINELELVASGGSRVEIGESKITTLTVDVSGGARVQLLSQIDSLTSDISGGATLLALEAVIQSATLDVSGGSTAQLNIVKQLDTKVSGGARVMYSGKPIIIQNVSGGGRIETVEEGDEAVPPVESIEPVEPITEPTVQPAVQ